MISTRINTFLANFHYLNTNNKRAGGGFFCNKQLTQALEKEARSLHEALTAIAQGKQSEQEQAAAFFKRVEDCFNRVEQLRAKHGKVVQSKNDPAITMVALDGSISKHVRKKPYPPGKFETQLVQALNEVNNAAVNDILLKKISAEEAKPFQDQCQSLMQKISTYQPPETCLAEVTLKAAHRA